MHIDTLSTMRMLEEAGMPEKQAEAVAQAINKGESGGWRARVESRLGTLEVDMAEVKTKINLSLSLHLVNLAVLVGGILAFFLNQ